MDQFNTREIASITWGTIFIVALIFFSLKNPQLRNSLIALIKAFFQTKIITSIIFTTSYLALIILLLSQLKIWDFSQIKNTFFWYITFAIGTLFNINTIRENSKNFFLKTIKSSINLSILLQFIVNFHTFNFFIELIVIIPFITFLAILSIVANDSIEQQKVKRIIDYLLTVIFFIFLVHFLIKLFRDFSNFANLQTLQDFFIPIILTIFYLPFLWVFLLYMKYEEIFVRLQFFVEDKKLIPITKFSLVLNFRAHEELIDEWFHHIKIHKIANYKQLFDSFTIIKHRNVKRKNLVDIPIPLGSGWNVYQAENFLSAYELQVKYSDIGDEIWFGSKLIKLDEVFNSSTLTYYIQGTEDIVKKLKIKVFIYDLNLMNKHLSIFIEVINYLLKKSLNVSLSQDQINNIYSLENFVDILHDKQIEFRYEKFDHSATPACEFVFSIKNPS